MIEVFENGVTRGVLGLGGGVEGDWRKLHNEELTMCTSY